MAFGDPIEEGACLLPGGSRVEALDIENLSARPTRRYRYSTVALVCTVAVTACMAVIALQGMGGSASTELAETTDTSGNSVVEAQTSKLPSWLQTDPVKLVPLNKLIREREMMHQMAEGKISAKIYKMEHLKQGPTPHQLAMHSVHVAAQMKQKQQQKQQLAEISSPHESDAHTPRSASEKAAADGLDDKVAAVVKHSLHVAEEKAHGKHVGKNHHAHHVNRVHHVQHHQHAQHAHAGKTAHVVMLPEIEKELAAEKDELEMVKHGEARQIALIEKHLQSLQKQEVHRLAMLKRRDHIEELKLKLGIEELAKKVALEKAQEPATPQPMSEKAKIKAEMARVEEEEHERLAALRAKLDKVQGHPHGHPHQAKAPPAKDAEDKAAVAPELGAGKAARETTLAAKAPACTNDDCDLGKEDDKWLAHKKSVDHYAHVAETGHGAAKAEAIRRMKALERQITHDFHHVTAFAVTQEHALPPSPSSS